MASSKTLNFLPEIFRTDTNKKFLSATIDQLVSEPNFKKINGYIGRQFAPTFKNGDSYIVEPTKSRQNYQLEPCVVIKDADTDSVELFSSYDDLLQKIEYYGGAVKNHDRLFQEEIYTFDGRFDFDKFINFNNYYWLPNGPDIVDVFAGSVDNEGDYDVQRNLTLGGYNFSGRELEYNPVLILARGGTYHFRVDQPEHKFWIQSEPGQSGFKKSQPNISTREVLGVTNNGDDQGTVTFRVPLITAQERYTSMLLKATVDMATDLKYSDIQNYPLRSFLRKNPNGIDGQNKLFDLDGKYIIFTNPDDDDTSWTDEEVYDFNPYDVVTATIVPASQRRNIWRIQMVPNGDDHVIKLISSTEISVDEKVYVRRGIENATKEFFIDYDGFFKVVPNITANLDRLYYQDGADNGFVGEIRIVDANNFVIDVNNDILGELNYTSPNGVVFTNGLKIRFDTKVTPEEYKNGVYYVEGVGKSIALIKSSDLITPETYASGGLTSSDYITINRASRDLNAWTRSNRWFHIEVVEATNTYNRTQNYPTQSQRANRPIIEFEPNYQLFNFGRKALPPIDYLDPYITDVFSEVEGTGNFYEELKSYNQNSIAVKNEAVYRSIIDLQKAPSESEQWEFLYNAPLYDEDRIYQTGEVVRYLTKLYQAGSITQGNLPTNINFWSELTSYQDSTEPLVFVSYDPETADEIIIDDVVVYQDRAYRAKIDFVQEPGNSSHWNKIFDIEDGRTIIFSGDNDPAVRSKIYRMSIETINEQDVPHFTPIENVAVEKYSTVVVLAGEKSGSNYWYDGDAWNQTTTKTSVNQPPLFDIIDQLGVSFGDLEKYPGSDFTGTKIFSYKVGSGKNDTVLNFPLSYRNFNSVGDIEFSNDFDNGKFAYLAGSNEISINLNSGYLAEFDYNDVTSLSYRNIWRKVREPSHQYQIISQIFDGRTNYFEIDVDPVAAEAIPHIKVYVNNKMIKASQYTIETVGIRRAVKINADLLTESSKVDIMIYSDSVSEMGYYQIPLNLDYNALNSKFDYLTLGQLQTHISRLGENTKIANESTGVFRKLRDIQYKNNGGTILQHASSSVFSNLFLTDPVVNFVDGLELSSREYSRFKNKFLELAAKKNFVPGDSPSLIVDQILKEINAVKNSSFAWYYSDMVPYGENRREYLDVVINPELRQFDLPIVFDDHVLSNRAVLVYINDRQLIKDRDYYFPQDRTAVIINDSYELEADDKIKIVDFLDTNGSYVPETPSKMGLYPKFVPTKHLDSTYQDPINVIQGHDGSIMPAFNDFRDDLLLELELRIYNNIKSNYNENIIDINEFVPGKFRNIGYSLSEFTRVLSRSFLKWAGNNKIDFSANSYFESNNPWTWNYKKFQDSVDGELLPGSWRAIYKYFFDTDRPNTHPWEMLGFSEEPTWWQERYGDAPYTGGNLLLWKDLSKGYIHAGPRMGYDDLYVRPNLLDIIPVDNYGNLKSPDMFAVKNFRSGDASTSYSVGNQGPVETAWRRSSDYPYAMQRAIALTRPAFYFGSMINIDRYLRDTKLDQLVNAETLQRITPKTVVINGEPNGTDVKRTAGYINWVRDYVKNLGQNPDVVIRKKLDNLDVRLGYRVAGYTDKNYIKILAEQSSPTSVNDSVILPDENYNVHLNKSSPTKKIVYSGVIVEKTSGGYTVSGYDLSNPYFTIIPSLANNNAYVVEVMKMRGVIYRDYQNKKVVVPYGYEFTSRQQLVDFLIGHSRYLVSQGFQFSETDGDLGEKRNWILSIKEFLHWSQQGWDNGNLIILSPAFDSLRVRVPNGVVDFIKNTPNGSKILDQNFSVIKSNQSTVYRNGGEFKISALEKQTICLAELDIVQYEHVLIFDNVTVFNDIIYKAESGNRQFRLKLLGNKTGNWTGEFNPPGFIYNSPTVPNWQSGVDYKKGSIVQFKDQYYTALENVIAATEFQQTKWQAIDRSSLKSGLLPNLAYNSQKFETIYDIDNPLADNDLLTYGAGLIGFRERDYLSDLSLGGISQIKFYQGFIKEKGTKNAVDSLTSAQFNNIAGGIDIYEEWALRVGEYGALESDARIEIPLDDSVFTDNPSTIQFIQGRIQTAETGAIGIDQNNLYRQPSKFKTNIFYHRNENSSTHDDITTAGYVNLEDVDGTIFNITDYQNLDDMLPKIGKGFKLWVAKDFDNEWNVYRVNETNNNINRLTYELDDYMAVHFDHAHTLSVGNVFVIKNLDDRFDGFYRVERVQDSLTVSVLLYKNINQLKDTRLITGNGVFLKTESMRVDDPVRIDDLEPLHGWQINDRIWADTVDVDGRWGVFEKTDPWEYLKEIKAEGSESGGGDRFGHSIKINSRRDLIVSGSPGYSQGSIKTFVKLITGEFRQTSTFRPDLVPIALGFGRTLDLSDYICAVGAPDSDDQQGLVFVYNFQSEASDFAIQVLNAIDGSSDDLFGHSISMSQDGQWIYVGAPGADKVYVYHRELNINKEANTFITDPAETVDTLTWELPFEYDDANSLQISTTGRIFIPGKDYNIVDDTIVFVADPGEIIVEVKQAPFYKLVETIEGTSNSSFGYSVKTDIDGSTLIIGSPDEGTGEQGGVHVYNRRIEAQLTATGKKIFVPSNDSLDVVDVFIDGILKTLNEDYTVDGDEYIFAVAPDSGRRLEFSTKTWDLVEHIVSPDDVELNHFGRSIDTDEQGNSIYISAPDYRDSVYQRGKVYRYVRNSKYLKKAIGTSINPTLTPGDTIYINRFPVRFSGTTVNDLVIDINGAKIIGIQASVDQGRISIVDSMINSTIGLEIFDADNGDTLSLLGLETFTLEQTIICPEEGDEVFGSKVTVDQFNNTLLISAENASIMQSITFDSKSTTFDVNTTKFIKTVKGSGAVYMFENMSNSGTGITNTGKMIYAQKMTLQNVYPGDQFGFDTDISRDLLLISSPGLEPYPGTNEYDIKLDNLRELSFVDTSNITSGFRALIISDSGNDGLWSIWTYNGSIFQRSNIGRLSNIGTSHLYNNKNNARCWNLVRRQEPRVDLSSLNRAMIYNKKSNTISTNLDFIDPAKGKILGIAEQDIDFKTELDPAIYTNGDQRVIIDHDLRWGDRQVGMIWWDLSKVRYLDYEQGSLIYRTKNWGKVFPGSTIDVSEWVESSVPPAQYLANGGSGSPKYGDSVYVVDTTVDAQTGLVNPRYYFWVTGKENTSGKKKNNSAAIIRNIIENPELQGVAYAGLLRSDAITLFNVNNYLSGDNIILQIDYANIANENTIHSEYELVQENRGESLIPEKIVTKMIDSLAGIDRIGNVVPDPRLGEVDRIGISFKPRQNMFRDRTRALKSMVEYVNSVFKQYPVTRQFNIAGFFKQDPIPASVNYNLSVPIVDELDYINTDDLSVGYRVLVENDSSNDGLWTIWRFNGNNFELSRIQSYKTDLYWEYQDWYAEDYDPSTKITYTVNTDKDLAALSVSVDDIIKVLFDYTGNFMIYRVTDDLSLETVAIGNGTIRLSDSLYALAFNGMGFDSANYDMVRYDKTPGIEIRNIIETVKDNIFINEFQLEFNRMFFTVINYLLTEQKHVDWVFKTSFISVVHRLRKLDQYPSFVRDNQDYYIDYINEVKPYRTQIREYLLNYQGIDSYNSDVSDFDIPAYYDSELDQYRSPSGELSKDTEILNLEKYQNWKSNHTYVIDQIIIENPGKDYAIAPVITIEGGGGSGAEAIAITDFNEITSVVITNPGSGYTSTPTVTVNGIGLGGKVYPVLRGVYSRNEEQNPQGYNLVRSFNPTIKFDRTAYTSSIPAWESNTVIYADRVSYENQVYRPKENNVFHVAIELSAIESFNVTLIDTYAIEGIVVDEDVPVYINNQYIDYEDDLYEIIPGSNSLRFLDVNPGDEIKVLLNSGEEEETFETFRIVTVSDFVVNKPLLPNTKVYLGDRLQVLDENYTIDEANNEINFIVDPETYILPLGYSVKVLVDPTLGVVIAPEDVPGAVEDDGEWILTTDYGQLSLSNIDDISEEQRVRGSGINTFNNEVHVLEINDNLIKFASQQRMRLVNGVWINDPLPPVAVTGNAVIEILTFITGIETTPIFDYRLFDLVPGDQSGNALDRVTSYYKPVEGGSGANPSQAIKGITYPGVKVQGLPFDESEDLASTSDLVDTHISSRYLDSSLGTRPEDITVDGGAYIDKFSSHAPEELIPGIMFDNLNFQIFTKPFEPWTSTFAGDGGIRDFNLGRKTDYFSLIVLLDGQPQIANEDFYLINNGNTIRFEITPADGKSIVVKGFIGTGNVYGHRYLHDIKETRKYYRISQAHTTTLRQPLGISATEILISDASVLPIPGLREPSRVIINGEIISYLEIDLANNKLKRLRRGVDGTGSPLSHPVGTRVVDISDNQLLPGNADGADWMNSTQEFGFREVGDFDYYNYDADKDGILPDADPAYDPEDPDYEGYGVITGVKGAIFDALDTIGGGTTPTEQARFLAKSASFNP